MAYSRHDPLVQTLGLNQVNQSLGPDHIESLAQCGGVFFRRGCSGLVSSAPAFHSSVPDIGSVAAVI